MNLLETILEQMSSVNKAQRKFIVVVLTSLMCLRGKANFRNLSRYSDYNEKTYSRGFKRDFDFVKFNQLSLNQISIHDNTLMGVIKSAWLFHYFYAALATVSQYSFHLLFALTTRKANIESALAAFHQAPDNFRRSWITYRWKRTISPEPIGSSFSIAVL